MLTALFHSVSMMSFGVGDSYAPLSKWFYADDSFFLHINSINDSLCWWWLRPTQCPWHLCPWICSTQYRHFMSDDALEVWTPEARKPQSSAHSFSTGLFLTMRSGSETPTASWWGSWTIRHRENLEANFESCKCGSWRSWCRGYRHGQVCSSC